MSEHNPLKNLNEHYKSINILLIYFFTAPATVTLHSFRLNQTIINHEKLLGKFNEMYKLPNSSKTITVSLEK